MMCHKTSTYYIFFHHKLKPWISGKPTGNLHRRPA
jgi:hypothetical protein